VRVVHVTPSAEVTMVPRSPTATNKPLRAATPRRLTLLETPDETFVHVVPLADERILPPLPTTINLPLPNVAPLLATVSPTELLLQVWPSGEERMSPTVLGTM
jgi:hypothetical protein